MALTSQGKALTEAHRLAQAQIAKDATRDFLMLWDLLDPNDLDGSFPRYADALARVLSRHRTASGSVSAAYFSAFRGAEGITGPLSIARASELITEQFLRSMAATGPVTARMALRKGVPLSQAMAQARAASAGAAIRFALEGGRQTIEATGKRDSATTGFARVTDGEPCSFCAMLASRGPVYKAETVGFHAHGACGCTSEPVFRMEGYTFPGKGADYEDLWYRATSAFHGEKEKQNAFRRAYERPDIFFNDKD